MTDTTFSLLALASMVAVYFLGGKAADLLHGLWQAADDIKLPSLGTRKSRYRPTTPAKLPPEVVDLFKRKAAKPTYCYKPAVAKNAPFPMSSDKGISKAPAKLTHRQRLSQEIVSVDLDTTEGVWLAAAKKPTNMIGKLYRVYAGDIKKGYVEAKVIGFIQVDFNSLTTNLVKWYIPPAYQGDNATHNNRIKHINQCLAKVAPFKARTYFDWKTVSDLNNGRLLVNAHGKVEWRGKELAKYRKPQKVVQLAAKKYA